MNTGDTVLVSQHNPPMQDIEQSLSSSLDRDGRGGMRAPLRMGGNKITNVAPGTDPTDVATMAQVGSVSSIPIGMVVDYWGTTPPAGYLFAAGQEVSRSTYAALFAVIGTAAGAGNGSTTFNLPDYRGRVGAGRENMANPATTRLNALFSSTLGAVGGAQAHTLTEAEMPAHKHTGATASAGAHSHSYNAAQATQGATGSDFGGVTTSPQETEIAGAHTHTINMNETGGGTAHNNVQPTIICNKIMRVS